MFTDQDNESFMKTQIMNDVKYILDDTNLYSETGTDGIPSLLYSKCWDTMGPPLTEVMQALFVGKQPSPTSLMVFFSKPKKYNSIKPFDMQ